MGDSVVIVAIPAVDEKVYRISSEKVPHLTLLYLGEQNDPEKLVDIIQFTQHAAANLNPFGLTVDYRGTLGLEQADVLFFEDNFYAFDLKGVKEFRHNLLLNDTIRRAYDSVEQYPQWTPHLTLGYPVTPAHKDDDADFPGIHHVRFDRIAVWTGDFEGPEFRLKYEDTAMEVAMSSITQDPVAEAIDNILEHYGVKGMKWGVRNDKGHEGEQVKTKHLAKLDKKWEADMNRNAYMKMYNAAADKMNNGGIDAINNKPEYKDVNFNDPKNSEIAKKYYAEHETAFHNAMVEAGGKLGMNPSGTKQFVVKRVSNPDGEDYDDVFLEPVGLDLKHAEGEKSVAYRLHTDKTGHVTRYEQVELELKHYGVKGMKWGVRRDEAASKGGASSGPTAVVVNQKKPGTFAKAEGGKGHPASEDAIVSLAARQKAKASTTDALTNQELRAAVERMQLEQKFSQLQYQNDRRGKGARFVAGLFGQKRYRNGKHKPFEDELEVSGEKTRKAIKEMLEAAAKA